MEYNHLINDLYSYLGIDSICVKEVVNIEYENGIELNIITNEKNYVKVIISKKIECEISHNELLFITNMNTPQLKGESIIHSINEDNELILWLRMHINDMVLNDLLHIMQDMHMKINDIIKSICP